MKNVILKQTNVDPLLKELISREDYSFMDMDFYEFQCIYIYFIGVNYGKYNDMYINGKRKYEDIMRSFPSHLLNIILNQEAIGIEYYLSDLNQDNTINIQDIILIVNIIIND